LFIFFEAASTNDFIPVAFVTLAIESPKPLDFIVFYFLQVHNLLGQLSTLNIAFETNQFHQH
jgi:hypothetical protein